jgi:hypothetical protein
MYGSVFLDVVSGTAHWSPEAPRRAMTPDRTVGLMFQGRAHICKLNYPLPPSPPPLYPYPDPFNP